MFSASSTAATLIDLGRAIRSRNTVALRLSGDRLLVVRREEHARRYAILPGGGVEPNEAAQAAALRELREETGLSGEVL